jgi:hypothetical protein
MWHEGKIVKVYRATPTSVMFHVDKESVFVGDDLKVKPNDLKTVYFRRRNASHLVNQLNLSFEKRSGVGPNYLNTATSLKPHSSPIPNKIKKILALEDSRMIGIHELNYKLYDCHRTYPTSFYDGSSCFEYLSDDIDEIEFGHGVVPTHCKWVFNINNDILKRTYRIFWLQGWKDLKVLPKDTDVSKLAGDGELGMPIYPTTQLYWATCVGRYMYEQPDIIIMTKHLTRTGLDFLKATVLAQLSVMGNRGHAMFSRYILPDSSRVYGNSLLEDVGETLRLIRNYMSAKNKDRSKAIFNFWGTIQRLGTNNGNRKPYNHTSWKAFMDY